MKLMYKEIIRNEKDSVRRQEGHIQDRFIDEDKLSLGIETVGNICTKQYICQKKKTNLSQHFKSKI